MEVFTMGFHEAFPMSRNREVMRLMGSSLAMEFVDQSSPRIVNWWGISHQNGMFFRRLVMNHHDNY